MDDKDFKPRTVKLIYPFGQIFYVRHDSMQKKWILTRVIITENGLLYGCTADGEEVEFYNCELSETVDPSFSTEKDPIDDD